jgi:hypothetical protein
MKKAILGILILLFAVPVFAQSTFQQPVKTMTYRVNDDGSVSITTTTVFVQVVTAEQFVKMNDQVKSQSQSMQKQAGDMQVAAEEAILKAAALKEQQVAIEKEPNP